MRINKSVRSKKTNTISQLVKAEQRRPATSSPKKKEGKTWSQLSIWPKKMNKQKIGSFFKCIKLICNHDNCQCRILILLTLINIIEFRFY